MTLARERGEQAVEAWTLCLMGDVAAHGAIPDVTTAHAHYDAALTLASELDMRPLVAHCHRGLGRPSRRTSYAEQAHDHLTRAAAKYREMGLTYWLEKLEKG
jgi:predicted protein tyrosine phosphatase